MKSIKEEVTISLKLLAVSRKSSEDVLTQIQKTIPANNDIIALNQRYLRDSDKIRDRLLAVLDSINYI